MLPSCSFPCLLFLANLKLYTVSFVGLLPACLLCFCLPHEPDDDRIM